MIFDTHAHIYPDKIAEKASKSIEKFYDVEVDNDGRVSTLLKLGEEAGIDYFVVHSVATVPEQVEHINNFIINETELHSDKFIGFATLHPDYENPSSEIDRVISSGLKGIKLHPDFQKFNIDDEKAYPIYEAAEGRLPILFHMGDVRYEYSKAVRLARILDRFPRLKVIGAHFAGYSEWQESAKVLEGRRIWVDTSSSLEWISPQEARKFIDIYGADRVMFASDYPMWRPQDELVKLSKIDLTQEEKDMILYKNAASLLLNTL